MVGLSQLPPPATPVTDNGGSLTVDNPQLSVVGSGTEAAAQRVTIATDSTGVLSVDDNGSSLTIDGTVAVSTLGTVTPGTAATSLGKAEDAAHSSGDVGVMALAVRQDTAAALGTTDADYQPLITDASGRLHTNVGTSALPTGAATAAKQPALGTAGTSSADVITVQGRAAMTPLLVDGSATTQPVSGTLTVNAHAVTNAGTFATQVDGAALTALQKIDDPVLVDDAAFTPATSSVMMAGFEVDDTGTDSVDEGDAGAARMSANRNQYIQIRDGASNERGATVNASNQLAVAGPVTNAGTFAVQDSEKLADNAGFTDGTTKVQPVGFIYDEVAGTALTENDIAAARLNVNRAQVGVIEDGVTRARYATVSAANALKVDGSAVTQPVSGTVTASNTAGDVAHDTADSGNPVKIGAKAVSAEPAVVTANDRVNLLADLVGKLIVLPYSNPENFVSGAITSAMTGTTSTSLLAAPAAGLRNYITNIVVSNAHATVGTDVVIQDGSGGTTLYTIPAAAVYGGASVSFPVPLRQPTTATAIFVANVTTGASTKVSASGYKGV